MKDSRLKYIEMSQVFNNQASDIKLSAKRSQRICERLAKHVSKDKPKTPNEFERHEYLKEFILSTCDANEKILNLLTYIQSFLEEVISDQVITEVPIQDTVRLQSDTIQAIISQREQLVKDIYDLRKNQINSK